MLNHKNAILKEAMTHRLKEQQRDEKNDLSIRSERNMIDYDAYGEMARLH